MKLRMVMASMVCVAICGTGLVANDAISLEGVKCVVKPTATVKKETALDYNGGKIFFCCDGCRKEFEKEHSKFETRANLQLAQTKQVKQARCPMSGEACKGTSKVHFEGTDVSFCCDGCKGTFEEANLEERLELAFAKDVFEKAFQMVAISPSTTNPDGTVFVQQPVAASSDNDSHGQIENRSGRSRVQARYRVNQRSRRR